MKTELKNFKKTMREAFALYVSTEGCSCCQDIEGHKEATKYIAVLLNIPMYEDKSGYDIYKYLPKEKK
jgi:hypothetical protein